MQFSIARLLLTVFAFAVAFGAFLPLGELGIMMSLSVGATVGWVILTSPQQETWQAARTGLCVLAGGAFSMAIARATSSGTLFSFVVGGMLGLIVGLSITKAELK